ncbi:MAG: DUF4270 family protein [Luteibaculaceae bacterium]
MLLQSVMYKMRKVLSLSAFFLMFTACEMPEDNLGIAVQPEEDQLNFVVVDTLTITAITIPQDSVRSDELNFGMLGSMRTAGLGFMRGSFYTQIRLSSNNVNFGAPFENLQADSIILSLEFDNFNYGKVIPQNIQVFEIRPQGDSLFNAQQDFFTNSRIGVVQQNLVVPGTMPRTPNYETGPTISEAQLPPQMRVPLSLDLANRFLEKSGELELSNNTQFTEFFQGLFVTVSNPPHAVNDGGLMAINYVSQNTNVTLYYTNTLTGNQFNYVFNINFESARFNRYDFDFTGSSVEAVLNGTNAEPDNLFLQVGGSVFVKVDIPNLHLLKGRSDILVNKAELIFPVEPGFSDDFSPIEGLLIAKRNEDGTNALVPDQQLGLTHLDGNFRRTDLEYRINITRYVQQILTGQIEQLPLVILPTGVSSTANHTILKSTTHPTDKTRLRLLLTKF